MLERVWSPEFQGTALLILTDLRGVPCSDISILIQTRCFWRAKIVSVLMTTTVGKIDIFCPPEKRQGAC